MKLPVCQSQKSKVKSQKYEPCWRSLFHRIHNLKPKHTTLIIIILFTTLFLINFISPVIAQQQGSWQFDSQVTEVGKNAERARQFIYWIFTHPPSYTVPVLGQIWSISRNVVYALFILVIAFTGLGYILAKRSGNLGPIFSGISSPIFGISLPTLFFRIGVFLIYVTFSYVIVLGLIQTSEITSRFFIEQFQGCRLFNINFTGSAPLDCKVQANDTARLRDVEKNYSDFVGYKDPNPTSQESVNTSLFLVRLTSLTYNFLAIVMILRQVVLWFMLMLSPFLAVLLPFMFIRNTGYIWIGVFFQWLFYGPLVSLFIAGLSQIWIKGIPYAFDFTRVDKANGQIFPTAINILYGGPAQILSPTNSANYIDTYAEYIIALIMLWVAILLPVYLLRIFRDYCCDILKQNQAALLSVLDKIRGVGTPPAGPIAGPTISSQTAMQLPFRKTIEELRQTSLKNLSDIQRSNTTDLSRSLSLSVSTLTDVASYEMNKKENKRVTETLNRIANPYVIPQEADRQWFSQVKKELEVRAQSGDKEAQQILSAAFKQPATVNAIPVSAEFPEITAKEIYNSIAKETSLTTDKIKEILRELPQITVENQVQVIAGKIQIPQQTVQQVVTALPQYTPTGVNLTTILAENPTIATEIAKRTSLSEEKVREVLESFSQSTLSQTDRVEKVSRETTISSEQVREVFNKLTEIITTTSPQIFAQAGTNKDVVSRVELETGVAKEKIQEVLQKTSQITSTSLTAKQLTQEEIITAVSQKTSLSFEKVKEVLDITNQLSSTKQLSEKEMITTIASKTSLQTEKVKEVISVYKELSSQTTRLKREEIISKVAKDTNVSEKAVEKILTTTSSILSQSAPNLFATLVGEKEVIAKLSQETGIPEESVKNILQEVAGLSPQKSQFEDQVEMIAEIANLPGEKVKDILGTISAVNLEKPITSKPKVIRHPTVSVEDYEEVRNMWINHYKLSEVPVSDTIKTREEWLEEDIKVLTNTLNLLTSLNPADKEKGMKQVAQILPFLLLGGFSEAETVIYLKAKLQAAKTVLSDLEEREKLKEEMKEEEKETLVEISQQKTEEKPKTFEEEAVQSLEIPENKHNENKTEKPN